MIDKSSRNRTTSLSVANLGRNEFIDFTKGVLILLVVIGHAIQYGVYRNVGFWDDPLFKAIYMFHMPMFMAVSGYLAHNGIKTAPLGRFIRTKLSSLLLPIIVWAVLYRVLVVLVLDDARGSLFSAIFHEIMSSLWFLWALLIGLSLTALANSFGRAAPGVSVLMFLALLMMPEKGNLHLFKYTFPFFLIGYYVASCWVDFQVRFYVNYLLVIGGVMGVISFYCWDINTYVYVSRMTLSLNNLWNIALRYFAGVMTSIFVASALFRVYGFARDRALTIRKILQIAGRDSIYIYILSGYVFTILLPISKKLLKTQPSILAGGLIAVIVGCCVALMSWYFGRALASNKITAALLFGGRRQAPIKLSALAGYR